MFRKTQTQFKKLYERPGWNPRTHVISRDTWYFLFIPIFINDTLLDVQ